MSVAYDLAANALRRYFDRRIATPAELPPAEWFPQAPLFASQWQDFAAEADLVARDILKVPCFHELMPEQASISANDDRDWRMFILKAYGVGIAGNLARCPRLAEVLAKTPNVLSASFSFLAPGKQIPSHRGPFRGVLRYHLMLSVPPRSDGSPAAVLEVDGHQHRLGAGESLLWDDTYPHAAWNHSGGIRIALLLDVLRPRMPWDVAVVSHGIIAAVGSVLRLRHSLRALMEGRGPDESDLTALSTSELPHHSSSQFSDEARQPER